MIERMPHCILSSLVLSVVLGHALSAESAEKTTELQSDWLVPALKLNEGFTNICRVDISFNVAPARTMTGEMTLFSGKPDYNAFGDADSEALLARKLRITATREPAPSQSAKMKALDRSTWTISSGDASLPPLRLVLSDTLAASSRLLVQGQDKPSRSVRGESNFKRIIPLRSERDDAQAAKLPMTSLGQLSLRTSYFRTAEGRFSYIRISGQESNYRFLHDRNHPGFNHFGDVTFSTLIGFTAPQFELRELSDLKDSAGQQRRIFKCQGQFDPRELTLVLHPLAGGRHRLLVKEDGQLRRILPMYSTRLRLWLQNHLEIQQASQTEQTVFDAVSREIPFFSGFRMQGNRITAAGLSLDDSNEHVLAHLADLPHLQALELSQCDIKGTHLSKLQTLRTLHVGHGKVSEETLKHIGHLKGLERLSFYTVPMNSEWLQHLASLHNLRSFSITNGDPGELMDRVNDEDVKVFSEWPNLEHLQLHGIPLTESSIRHLRVSSNLKRVNVAQGPFAAALNYAQSIPAAVVEIGNGSINLSDGSLVLPNSVSDDDMRQVAMVMGLRLLDFNGPQHITDAGLAHLAETRLIELRIRHARRITDAGIAHIGKTQTLETLNLWYCRQLTTESVHHLKQLPKLMKINVTGTEINHAALKAEIPNCEIKR